MPQAYISPLGPFTLESLVALRRWSAEQRVTKKRPDPAKSQRSAAQATSDESKTEKATE
jgi:hypothetical protein